MPDQTDFLPFQLTKAFLLAARFRFLAGLHDYCREADPSFADFRCSTLALRAGADKSDARFRT